MAKETVLVLILAVLTAVSANYTCSYNSGSLCFIQEQTISATDSFIISKQGNLAIIISDGYMPKMPDTIFSNYPNTTMLSVSNVSLQELSSSNFENAQKLTSLLIMLDSITTVNNGTFVACSQLQSLQLTKQRISFIDAMAFKGLKKLQNLFLSFNQLTAVNPQILHPLSSLTNFVVDNNFLTAIDSSLFAKNPNLYSVSFDSNKISSMPKDLFQGPLASFSCSGNLLTSGYTFGASYVDLSSNRLTNVTFSTGENTVQIHDNFVRKLICPTTNLTVSRFFAQNNSLTNFLCIRDMVNLTDLFIYNNKMPNPTRKPFLKLNRLKILHMYGMSRFTKVRVKALAPLTSLLNLRVDQLTVYKGLNQALPQLYLVGLYTNNWNCTYVNKISSILKDQKIIMSYVDLNDRSRCAV